MLLNLLMLIAGFSVLMVGMTRLTMFLAGRSLGRTVDRFHREAEFIINTGLLPDSWISEIGAGWTYKRYCRYIDRKFGKMNRFFRNAPVFEDDEARDLLLSSLEGRKAFLRKEGSYSDVAGKLG